MIGSATFSDSIQPGYGVFSADSTIAGRTIVSCFGFAPRSVRSPRALDRPYVSLQPRARARSRPRSVSCSRTHS